MSDNEQTQRIIDMLTDVLRRQTSLETKWDAAHNLLLEVMQASTQQGWDIQKMKATLYGPEGEGGGVVDQVKELKGQFSTLRTFGVSLPRWAQFGVTALLVLVTVASVCVVFLAYLAVRASVPGALP